MKNVGPSLRGVGGASVASVFKLSVAILQPGDDNNEFFSIFPLNASQIHKFHIALVIDLLHYKTSILLVMMSRNVSK